MLRRVSTQKVPDYSPPIGLGSDDPVGGHILQGEYRTRMDSIQGDIWQVGGEPDALILGISFDTKKQILLNTLHIARPEKQTSSELDKGLFITRNPVPVR
jgi:hypothetical protein